MITNVLDRRTHPHRWTKVDAVAEETWHDNNHNGDPNHDNADSDLPEASADTFAVKSEVSVAEAVIWAQQFPDEVTLYFYDPGTMGGDIPTD